MCEQSERHSQPVVTPGVEPELYRRTESGHAEGNIQTTVSMMHSMRLHTTRGEHFAESAQAVGFLELQVLQAFKANILPPERTKHHKRGKQVRTSGQVEAQVLLHAESGLANAHPTALLFKPQAPAGEKSCRRFVGLQTRKCEIGKMKLSLVEQ